jgi:hypothetical protein
MQPLMQQVMPAPYGQPMMHSYGPAGYAQPSIAYPQPIPYAPQPVMAYPGHMAQPGYMQPIYPQPMPHAVTQPMQPVVVQHFAGQPQTASAQPGQTQTANPSQPEAHAAPVSDTIRSRLEALRNGMASLASTRQKIASLG